MQATKRYFRFQMQTRMLLMFLAWLCCLASFFNLWVWLQARRYEKKNTVLQDTNLFCAIVSCGLCVLLCCLHIVFMEREQQIDSLWQEKWIHMHNVLAAKLSTLRVVANQTEPTDAKLSQPMKYNLNSDLQRG